MTNIKKNEITIVAESTKLIHVTRKMQLSFALKASDLLVKHKIESVPNTFSPFSCLFSRLADVATVFFTFRYHPHDPGTSPTIFICFPFKNYT